MCFIKKLVTLLILIFSLQSITKAENIGEFEIEGISLGNSLLNYFNEEEIKKDILTYEHNNEFIASFILRHESFEIYQALTIAYKTNDKNYIIHSIEASIHYRDNIDECYDQKKIIVSELSELFGLEPDNYEDKYTGDPSGKSTVEVSDIYLESGGVARVICYDIDEELSESKNWWDRLSVIINSKEFADFLRY